MTTTNIDADEPHSGGTIRWAAPELLRGPSDGGIKQTITTKSDVYALSMVIVEVCGFCRTSLSI